MEKHIRHFQSLFEDAESFEKTMHAVTLAFSLLDDSG
jgi:hypothetical protein